MEEADKKMLPGVVYRDLEKAESTLYMLRDSCEAVSIADNRLDVSEAWFEGVQNLCHDAGMAVTEALNYFTQEETQEIEAEDPETIDD
ncbi:MAG: hypothetical protein JW883_05255 [Deltaproteobacteria bacterium]|nr:hypothetical protein [Deltaproteobacteria bacterium]